MYESRDIMLVPCPCGDEGCEVEVATIFGLDIPFRVTRIPDECISSELDFSEAERNLIRDTAHAQHEVHQELLQGRSE